MEQLNALCNTHTSFTSRRFVLYKKNPKIKPVKREYDSAQ